PMAKKLAKRPKQSAKSARNASRAKAQQLAKKKAPHQSLTQLFPVVGVGASAGGLEAFTALLKHLPIDSGMAFVLIQHLDPKQPSQLAGLLSKATEMPVLEVNTSTLLEPDHVYLIGSGVCLSMSDGHLLTEERE